jgi:hypothetical protein
MKSSLNLARLLFVSPRLWKIDREDFKADFKLTISDMNQFYRFGPEKIYDISARK